MKKLVFLLVLTLFTTMQLVSAGESWTEDYDKALATAKSEKKMVLLDFTGSDWCGWCIKLDKEVFEEQKFKSYANANLVLVKLDFPRGKSQSKELKAQNENLSKKYRIEGYPTVIVLNAEGKQVGELGYMEGGPKAFIDELEKLKGK